MPKRANDSFTCEYFVWNLIRRDGVYYADGRKNQPNLGKHTLGTRDRSEAMDELRQLDRQLAVRHGRCTAARPSSTTEISISDGWESYLADVAKPEVLGGATSSTRKR